MSSILRKFSQIPVRTKYLLVMADPEAGDNVPTDGERFGVFGASILQVTNGTFLNLTSTNTVAGITAAVTAAGATVTPIVNTLIPLVTYTGRLFKDLGRELTVYDPSVAGDLHVATYRECQLVNGAAYEGVVDADGYGADYYVRVWAADGANVVVGRTG
jgi:hypothetical protein